MANIKSPTPYELTRARQMLREVTVSLGVRIPHTPRASAQDLLDLRTPRQSSVTVRLVPYAEALLDDKRPGSNTVLVLSKAPAALLERLRREHANFVDVGRGVVRLELPGLLIDRSDVPLRLRAASFAPSRPLRSPFGDRASLVLRELTRWPAKAWHLREIAAAATVSTMTASHVVRQLEAIGAVHITPAGRARTIRLASLRALVEHWSHHYDWNRNRRVTVLAPVGDRQRFLWRLPEILGRRRWALTMHAGASLIAPMATWEKVHVYLRVEQRTELTALAEDLGYEVSEDGALVLMEPWYRESIWMDVQTVRELPVVSPLQLAVDLWNYPVRGREQAEHLLRTLAARDAGS